jgi:hypothetical protein
MPSPRRLSAGIIAGTAFSHSQGHERRPFKWRLLDNFRYAPGSDRGRVAAQYVAKGHKPKCGAVLFDREIK